SDLVKNYDLSRNLVYDEAAKAPYLSINRSLASEDEFVSFDNEKSLAEKVVFARQNQLGGIMIWELSAGYLASRPSGARMPLLSAVKQASVMSLPEVS